jgi:hypothetical protein
MNPWTAFWLGMITPVVAVFAVVWVTVTIRWLIARRDARQWGRYFNARNGK